MINETICDAIHLPSCMCIFLVCQSCVLFDSMLIFFQVCQYREQGDAIDSAASLTCLPA